MTKNFTFDTVLSLDEADNIIEDIIHNGALLLKENELNRSIP